MLVHSTPAVPARPNAEGHRQTCLRHPPNNNLYHLGGIVPADFAPIHLRPMAANDAVGVCLNTSARRIPNKAICHLTYPPLLLPILVPSSFASSSDSISVWIWCAADNTTAARATLRPARLRAGVRPRSVSDPRDGRSQGDRMVQLREDVPRR